MESTVTPSQSSRRTAAWVALVTVWFVWGSTYLGIRVAVATIPPLLMAGVRYMIAGALMVCVLWLFDRSILRGVTQRQWRSLALLAFLLLVCGNGALCYAEVRLPSGLAALVAATVPVWMLAIDACLSRRRPSWLAAGGLLLGIAGVAILLGIRSGAVPIGPALVVLCGAFAWSLGSVYARHHAEENEVAKNPLLHPALEMFLGGVGLVIAGLIFGELPQLHVDEISKTSFEGFLWLVTMGAIVGYSAYGYAVRMLPTRVVATYAYVNPVVAVALGAIFLGEPITINIIAGGAAIVIAVVAILAGQR